MIMTILRRFTAVCLAMSLCLTTVACGGGSDQANSPASNVSQTSTTTKLSDGQYQLQQATYDDATGEYTLFLINSKPPTFVTENLQMARLTDEEIKEGKKSYLKVESGQPILYLTEDFKIEYVHNVVENKTNPQTGRQETVVVRQENSFWTPFAAAVAGNIAGQAIGSLLFRPQYYVPPVYQPGQVLTGYGGYGSSYDQAVSSYRSRYNQPPAAVRNRTAFRTTGTIRRTYPSGSSVRNTPNRNSNSRPSGSGFGGSELRPSNSGSSRRNPSGSSFGSGGRSSGRRAPSFGGRRR
ncbi:hypothetical protein H6G41_26325 [Tolypothrix sp. FACHB-123]|uniref:hypothetical protein n=1 Tax=Tolypothrix sp. FACHB-123 TaxID=2692868 RepID=UPI0016866720|nr:hypothetical protein [Tolypothrix sp. FACHB-123]MBD2358086.1 hypothetical protein [Tolypothrix sp. FACHB-123]